MCGLPVGKTLIATEIIAFCDALKQGKLALAELLALYHLSRVA